VAVDREIAGKAFRFPVQLVLRPNHEFRGYAGQIASGTIRTGDQILVSPSGRRSRVKRIVTWDGDLSVAEAPMSVTLTLEDEVDVSRGDVLSAATPLHTARHLEANVVWMDERPLDPARVYLLKHAARTVSAELDTRLNLNDIGLVTVTAARPLVFDAYEQNRTAAAGKIVRALDEVSAATPSLAAAERLALAARSAPSEEAAIDAVRRLLEDILT
jgi:sulfate adenylyltransferase subunit 1 (EFTu-like GTPase family)